MGIIEGSFLFYPHSSLWFRPKNLYFTLCPPAAPAALPVSAAGMAKQDVYAPLSF
jgi:hypothetical protein